MDAHMPPELPDRMYTFDEGNAYNIMSEGGNVTSTTAADLKETIEGPQHDPKIEQMKEH
jgi:hypothetical protein